MLLRTGSVVVPAVSLTMAICWPVNQFIIVLLPTLRRPKEAYSRFQFIAFHSVILYLRFTTVTPTPPSSTFSGWKVRTSCMPFSSWWMTCMRMP